MKEYICITTCTFSGRYFNAGEPLKVTDDTEVPEHFRQVGDPAKADTPSTTLMSLPEALDLLDHDDDGHWTKAGIPDVKAVETIMGDGAEVSRADIEAAAPDLKREQS